jgi:RNA polymerase sigma-70 factor (ECF subfamily)
LEQYKILKKDLEHSFVSQLEKHQNIIHKVCRLYTNDQDSHNDLFQEVTIQLWKAFPKFRGDAKFSTWMYRIALNTAITLYRKSKRKIKTNDISDYNFKIKADEYDDTEEEQLKLMYSAIKLLSDIEKALIFLYLEEKNYKEISITMGISEVNARVKMNRAKGKLKKNT